MFDIWQNEFDTNLWVGAGFLVFLSYFIIGTAHMRGVKKHGFWYWSYGLFIYACGIGHLAMIYFMAIDANAYSWKLVVYIEIATALASVLAVFKPKGYLND